MAKKSKTEAGNKEGLCDKSCSVSPPRIKQDPKVESVSTSTKQSYAEPVGKPIRFGSKMSRPAMPETHRTNCTEAPPKRKCEPEDPIVQTPQQAEQCFPKRPRLEVFELGNDSDADDAVCPNSSPHSETPEQGVEFNWYR